MRRSIAVWALAVLTMQATAQTPEAPPATPPAMTPPLPPAMPAPPTRLEAALYSRGVVMVKGFTDIGTIGGEFNDGARVTAIELIDPEHKQRERGIAVTVHQGSDPIVETVSYVDFDEIEPLLSALDSLAKIDPNLTTLEHAEVDYRTRGDLEISNIDRNNVRYIRLQGTQLLPTGQIVVATAHFALNRLDEIKRQISAARDALARAQQ